VLQSRLQNIGHHSSEIRKTSITAAKVKATKAKAEKDKNVQHCETSFANPAVSTPTPQPSKFATETEKTTTYISL